MVLLDEVVAHTDSETVCALQIRRSLPFADRQGRVPVWVSLEFMAQCAAARGGLRLPRSSGSQVVGLLVGARRLRFAVPEFLGAQRLAVEARDAGRSGGLFLFDCTVRDADSEDLFAEGRISVYLQEDRVLEA